MNGFKKFIMKGNVVELAVAVIIGTAFSNIVNSMVKDIITPMIGMLGGQPDFSALKIGTIGIGNFLNALIAFLIQALVVYYAIVMPFTVLMQRLGKFGTPEEPAALAEEVVLLTEIRDLLKK